MNKLSQKTWIGGVVLLIVAALVIVGITASIRKSKDSLMKEGPITVGYIGPLSGDAAIYGETIKSGIELRVKEINESGGVGGHDIHIVYEDGKCDGKAASLAAQKLITVDKVRVVLGGQCSNETMAAAPIAEENKVLLFTPFSSAPAVTDAGDYVFQMWPSDVLAAEQIAIMMKDRGAKKVAIISELGEYPQGLRVALKPFFAKQGIEVVYDESYASDVTDFRSYASKLNAIGADSVFLNPQASASGARVAKALRDIGNTSQFYAYYITDSAFVKSGSSVNGTYLLDFDTVSDKSKGAKLSEEYKNVYGKYPAYMTGVVLGYESASIVFNAMRHIGSDDAAKIKDYLYTMKPFSGVTGDITFDKNGGPLGNHNFVIQKIVGGELMKQ